MGDVDPSELSAIDPIAPVHDFPVTERSINQREHPMSPVGESALHSSADVQTTGAATYVDDIPPRQDELHAAIVGSNKAHAKVISIDYSEALALEGVVDVITHKDIPGVKRIGAIFHDEDFLAIDRVEYVGHPVALVVAVNDHIAHQAARLVRVSYEEEHAVLGIDQALEEGSFMPDWNHKIDLGSPEELSSAFSSSDIVVEGNVKIGGQEHFYFEPQVTVAIPNDGQKEMHIVSSTQNPTHTSQHVALVLGMSENRVITSVKRLGGGFGGKETSNIQYSCLAAVAAHKLKKPVRLLLRRDEDMKWTGKRHPVRADYRVGASKDGNLKALDVSYISNAGYSMDLSGAVMDRCIFFTTNSYKVPNVHSEGRLAKTNLPTNTAFRGFGGPQSMLTAESWIEHISHSLNLPPEEVREKNLFRYEDTTHYGQQVKVHMDQLWEHVMNTSEFAERRKEIDEFNAKNTHRKRGISVVPTKFGLSFTATFLNQGAALVHIYTDGTVLVSHGGVEMGQGLHTKMLQIAAHELKAPIEHVHIAETATDKAANTSATAASMGSDINGMAVLDACKKINQGLAPYREKCPDADLGKLAQMAYMDRVSLSAHGFHKVPIGGYDFETGKGNPFHYYTTGAACAEVEVDTLTGDYRVRRADVAMDLGDSINPSIDIGQIEGAFAQGVGWLTMEELVWGDRDHTWLPKGHFFTSGPGNYKIPSMDDVASEFHLSLIKASDDYPAVHSSRGVGEPPILLSASVFFAIRDAIGARRKEMGVKDFLPVRAPLTAERIRMACVDPITEKVLGGKDKATAYEPKASF